MMVWTLFLAAVGFALLVVALITGSVLWAWICIGVCVAGAFVLLASVLWARPVDDDVEEPVTASAEHQSPAAAAPPGPEAHQAAVEPHREPDDEAGDGPPTDPAIPRYPEGPNEITQELGPFPTRAERRRSIRHRK